MTAPDPRPYAAPTDLVTAEDVLAWMLRPSVDRHAEHVASGGERLQPYIVDVQMLAYRLERERRQACRRGCSAMAHEARIQREAERFRGVSDDWRARYRAQRIVWIRRALAFRAAARQP